MANLQATVRADATPDANLFEVCTKLNESVRGNVAPGQFITFFRDTERGKALAGI